MKALRTHLKTGNGRPKVTPTGLQWPTYAKHEPIAMLPNCFLRKRRGMFWQPSLRTGVRFIRPARNNILLLHETHRMLSIVFQQSWYSYTSAELTHSKRMLARVRHFFTKWEDIFNESRTVKRWLESSSIVLRVAENSVKHSGRLLSRSRLRTASPDHRSSIDG
jgi:hypothetical protein